MKNVYYDHEKNGIYMNSSPSVYIKIEDKMVEFIYQSMEKQRDALKRINLVEGLINILKRTYDCDYDTGHKCIGIVLDNYIDLKTKKMKEILK